MKRRAYLSVIGGTTALAGCSATPEDDTPSSGSGGNNTTNPSGDDTSSDPSAGSASFGLVESDIPEVLNADEDASISITVENTGGSTGSCSGQARIKKEEGASGERFGYYNDTIESKERKEMEISGTVPAETGEHIFQFTSLEETRTTSITDENATPEIQQVNITSEWNEYGDLISNAIDSVTIGERALVVGRHTAFVHDGTYQTTAQTAIYEESTDERVFFSSHEADQIVDANGYTSWESPFPFDTSEWTPGSYRAEFTVRDDISEEVSSTETTNFEVVE